MITVPVRVSCEYDVLIGSGLLGQVSDKILAMFPEVKKIAIITDENVAKFYLESVAMSLVSAGFSVVSSAFPAGEDSKTGEVFLSLLSWLAESQVTRSDLIIALGGGVVGDLTGFTAASYLRGVPFVQIPTTLLAMVDSSVGGKTGIDLPEGKNLAGAFYQPRLVVCDPEVLATLPGDIFNDGMAEVIKHGMLGGGDLLDKLQEMPVHNRLEEIIAANVRIKRDIVQNDEFDVGERMLLNFGHTISHAIEVLSGYDISHGRAVAIGMAMITRAAVKKKFCSPECLLILEDLLSRYNLPDRTDYSPEDIYNAALKDKKRTGGEITEVIPVARGRCELRKMRVEELVEWVG